MGYALATYDGALFRMAMRNFLFAIITSLVASTAYFTLSPISTAHSELLARTSPSIYDVLIALFGGLAGIVALSSRNKGNVLTGVAIATALMPPLCTAGYGIATAQPAFFLGAAYLFTINTIFIAFASVLFARLLRFPIHGAVSAKHRKSVQRSITAVLLLVLIPSIYFGWQLARREQFEQQSRRFVQQVSTLDGNYLLRHHIQAADGKITLIYGGSGLDSAQKQNLKSRLADFGLNNASLEIEQGISTRNSSDESPELQAVKDQVWVLREELKKRDMRFDSLRNAMPDAAAIFAELRVFYPQIVSIAMGSATKVTEGSDEEAQNIPLLNVALQRDLGADQKAKIQDWFRLRSKHNQAQTYFYLTDL
jgi:uncharacterized hydrophobic protein (TIGR00271 family)